MRFLTIGRCRAAAWPSAWPALVASAVVPAARPGAARRRGPHPAGSPGGGRGVIGPDRGAVIGAHLPTQPAHIPKRSCGSCPLGRLSYCGWGGRGHLCAPGGRGSLTASSAQRGHRPRAYWVPPGIRCPTTAGQTASSRRQLILSYSGVAVASPSAWRAGPGRQRIARRYVATASRRRAIEVDDWKGTIVEVGLASVTISDGQGELVEIPHGYLLTRPVRRSGT